MPNKKISELTTVASPLSADYIPVVEAGVTKKATLASLPLSDAEVTALALKAPLASPTFTGTQTMPSVAITGGTIAGITDLAVADGGTGASTAADARTNLVAAASGANTDITSLAAPALGAATATTAATNDSSTKVATTAFTNPGNSIGGSGYYKLPGGLIIQWGSGTSSGTGSGNFVVTFPLEFPTSTASVVAQIVHPGTADATVVFLGGSTTSVTFTTVINQTNVSGVGVYWIAIGY
jgi:hypothetical protein